MQLHQSGLFHAGAFSHPLAGSKPPKEEIARKAIFCTRRRPALPHIALPCEEPMGPRFAQRRWLAMMGQAALRSPAWPAGRLRGCSAASPLAAISLSSLGGVKREPYFGLQPVAESDELLRPHEVDLGQRAAGERRKTEARPHGPIPTASPARPKVKEAPTFISMAVTNLDERKRAQP